MDYSHFSSALTAILNKEHRGDARSSFPDREARMFNVAATSVVGHLSDQQRMECQLLGLAQAMQSASHLTLPSATWFHRKLQQYQAAGIQNFDKNWLLDKIKEEHNANPDSDVKSQCL